MINPSSKSSDPSTVLTAAPFISFVHFSLLYYTPSSLTKDTGTCKLRRLFFAFRFPVFLLYCYHRRFRRFSFLLYLFIGIILLFHLNTLCFSSNTGGSFLWILLPNCNDPQKDDDEQHSLNRLFSLTLSLSFIVSTCLS